MRELEGGSTLYTVIPTVALLSLKKVHQDELRPYRCLERNMRDMQVM